MEKLSKKEFKKNIVDYFTNETGLTLDEAKTKIQEQMKIDEYNTDIKVDNVRLFYTTNENYCGGISQGFGSGWYLTNVGFTGGGTIKL